MTKLKNTFQKLGPRVAKEVWVRKRPEHLNRPVVQRGSDGRITGVLKRSWDEFIADFWTRVVVDGENDCWNWTGATKGKERIKQYGVAWLGKVRFSTHRLSYEITNGTVPAGLLVLHTCDNPRCVNPKHLYAGTNKQNSDDCIRRGRAKREFGENRYNATLTNAKIKDIRKRYTPRCGKNGCRALAREFGVVPSMISSITKRKRWRHI